MLIGRKNLSNSEIADFLNTLSHYLDENEKDFDKESINKIKELSENPDKIRENVTNIDQIRNVKQKNLRGVIDNLVNRGVSNFSKKDLKRMEDYGIDLNIPKHQIEYPPCTAEKISMYKSVYERKTEEYPNLYLFIIGESLKFPPQIMPKVNKKDFKKIISAMRTIDGEQYMHSKDNCKLYFKYMNRYANNRNSASKADMKELVNVFFGDEKIENPFRIQETSDIPIEIFVDLLRRNVATVFHENKLLFRNGEKEKYVFRGTVDELVDVYERGDWVDSVHKPIYNKLLKSPFFSGHAAVHQYDELKDVYDKVFDLFVKTNEDRRKTSNTRMVSFCRKATEVHQLSDDSMPATIVVFCSL